MINRRFAIKEGVTAKEIRDFLSINKIKRAEFADFLNVSVKTVNHWLSSNKEISGPIVALMTILNNNKELFDYYRLNKTEYPMRLFYMNKNDISTVIDVDYVNRRVKFRNYTDNIVERAFGVREKVSFEDYEHFIESRCFPSSRDKMKIELEKLDLPFYDPISIIEKTQGRLADDDNWIRIERNNND